MKIKRCSIKYLVAIVLLLILSLSFGISTVAIAESAEVRYANINSVSAYAAVNTSETVTFTKRETEYVEISGGIPRYTQIGTYPNSCGATAGAIVVGYYDKYYEDLIPNYTAYVASRYKGNDSTYIPQLMGELYNLMRTNVDDVGVSESDCLNGLRAYVEGKGRSISYTNVRTINKINESAYTNAINENKPVLLFCDKMDMYNFSQSEKQDVIVKTAMEGAHVAVGYGIYIIKYYNDSTLFRTDKYLRIGTGLGLMTSCYLKMSATDWCNAAYAVTIS